MIKFTVVYPWSEGSRFDHDYYLTRHVPMVEKLLGSQRSETDRGICGFAPGSSPAFHALGHFYFDDLKTFQDALAASMGELGPDVANYTDVAPVIQVSEIAG